MKPIYLDNAATTKPLSILSKLCEDYIKNEWYNPSSLYKPGVYSQIHINNIAEILLKAFGSNSHRCVFTSGGTESADTVILKGAHISKNSNFICGGAEHPCVEESFKNLAAQGYEVRYANADEHGLIDIQNCIGLIDNNTALISIMHVNNETGAKNDISKIASLAKAKNPKIIFHSDGVQAFLKEECDTTHIDYYTVSAHKVNAFKGTGAIFYNTGAPLKPLILGGGQQNNLRSGTENTLGIFAFGKVCEYYINNKVNIKNHYKLLRNEFINSICDFSEIKIITPNENRCDHIVCLSAPGAAGETILHILEEKEIFISTGSACSSKKGRSRIASALGLSADIANGIIRISFSIDNTSDDVVKASEEIKKAVRLLKGI